MSSLDAEEKTLETPGALKLRGPADYPLKWIVDMITPVFSEKELRQIVPFYALESTKVLVGKQRHELPFCRANICSKYLDDLYELGIYHPKTLMEEVDVEIDIVFATVWTVLNIPRVSPSMDFRLFRWASFEASHDLLDFLRLDVDTQPYGTLVTHWLTHVRPMPTTRFDHESKYCLWWKLISPDYDSELSVQSDIQYFLRKDHVIVQHVSLVDRDHFKRSANKAMLCCMVARLVSQGWALYGSPIAPEHLKGDGYLGYLRVVYSDKKGKLDTLFQDDS